MSFGRALARGSLGRRRVRRRGRSRFGPGGRSLRTWRPLGARRVRIVVLAVVVLAALLLGGWLWLRDSSLVAVTRVRVTGVSGPDAGSIRTALIGAARGMTTLDVNTAQLRAAVSSYPVVADVHVSTQFPHGMRIRVVERPPVALVSVAGRSIAVASDGTLLHDLNPGSSLPVVPIAVPPGGTRVTGSALDAIRLLAGAPAPLLARVEQVTTVAGHGLVAKIRGGPSVYFGDASDARAKWASASAVLADPGSTGAIYIDVTDPVRPAAGAGSAAAGAAQAGAGSTASTAATGTSSDSATGTSASSAPTASGAASAGGGG